MFIASNYGEGITGIIMKTKTILQTIVFSAVFLTLQGCYTQLSMNTVVRVLPNKPDPRPANPYPAESDSIIFEYADPEINEYHYHFYDRDNSCFGGCPDYYEPNYYVNIHSGYDYYWHRPYPRRYWGWTNRYHSWSYPYYYAHYYDPYYYDYGWGYSGYWSYHPYNSWHYGGYYDDDSPDHEKRDWDRRGDNLTDRTIQRPAQTNSPSGSSLNNIVAPVSSTQATTTTGNSRTVIRSKNKDDSKSDKGTKKRRSVRRSKNTKRGSHDSAKPKEAKRTRSSRQDEPKPNNNSSKRNKASHKRRSSLAYSNFEKAVSFAATVSKSVKSSSRTSKTTKTKKRSSSGSKKSSRSRPESKRSIRR